MKLPKQIYVTVNENLDEPFLEVHDTPDSIDNAAVVGIYTLQSTKTMVVTRALEV